MRCDGGSQAGNSKEGRKCSGWLLSANWLIVSSLVTFYSIYMLAWTHDYRANLMFVIFNLLIIFQALHIKVVNSMKKLLLATETGETTTCITAYGEMGT